MDRLRLGIIGAGCIGSTVARSAICDSRDGQYSVTAIADLSQPRAEQLADQLEPRPRIVEPAELVEQVDVILESAAAQVVPEIIRLVEGQPGQGAATRLVVMSVGGLLGVEFNLIRRLHVHVPSGALGALDAVRAMKEAGLEQVVLTTTKPPAGLGIDVAEPTVLFEGPAAEVVVKYPKNTNVAMALSLAGLGPERTVVKLVADPGTDCNTHHVVATGKAGTVEFTSRNVPFPENPRTSYLAALSAISCLRGIASSLQFG